jgi:hypothetical protein
MLETSFETIESQVLELPTSQKALLVDHLLKSIEADSETEQAWADEIKKREQGTREDGFAWIDGPEAIQNLRNRLS